MNIFLRRREIHGWRSFCTKVGIAGRSTKCSWATLSLLIASGETAMWNRRGGGSGEQETQDEGQAQQLGLGEGLSRLGGLHIVGYLWEGICGFRREGCIDETWWTGGIIYITSLELFLPVVGVVCAMWTRLRNGWMFQHRHHVRSITKIVPSLFHFHADAFRWFPCARKKE